MTPNLVLYKKLMILPVGIITGGFLQYSVDDETGIVSYNGIISVHMLFMSKDVPIQGSTQLDPELLLSEKIKPGLSYRSNGITVDVLPNRDLSLDIKSSDVVAAGTAELDLSGKDISIKTVHLLGTVKGFSITIKLAA